MNEKILTKLSEAQDSVKLVRENFPKTYEEFMSMKKLERDGIYKNIEFAIENILDICAIILKNEDLPVPDSYEDILDELKNAQVIEDDVIEIIRQMRGFRNYLVHRYGILDDEIAYHDIRDSLADFTRTFKEIKDIIS
ncbi:MAG: DUF86 domain-containing protein [Candidatus Methanofastidiosia archaeon]